MGMCAVWTRVHALTWCLFYMVLFVRNSERNEQALPQACCTGETLAMMDAMLRQSFERMLTRSYF